MKEKLEIYNSLTRQKETFKPIHDDYVGMYVCGPTVYSDVHLGNCRTFINFDVIYRFLKYAGFKVRYVRNITDVGHLEGDSDCDAEDKVAKKARLEQLEPMEIVQQYTNGFHDVMRMFNTLSPSIEPTATGHIMEQIEMVQTILDNGYAYEVNGSVYFDTEKYRQDHPDYGKLSGKVWDELIAESRELKNQGEKKHAADFAIWVKADPRHIMRWNSPWSTGFPGWHLECSAMSTKYLGTEFDIHGGGMDLKFPHHENEIAQNVGCCGKHPAKIWMHANMLTLNGKKMAKSEGTSIMPHELFTGNSPLISKGFSPMVVRFFMLQTHYRSTLDFSNEALLAGEKGFQRLTEGIKSLREIAAIHPTVQTGTSDEAWLKLWNDVISHMCDDFNTPRAIAALFELVSEINRLKHGHIPAESVSTKTIQTLAAKVPEFVEQVLGIAEETDGGDHADDVNGLMELILHLRQKARANKDWPTGDFIRDKLKTLQIEVKDTKEGTSWNKLS